MVALIPINYESTRLAGCFLVISVDSRCLFGYDGRISKLF
nr:MAG TPA: hypothetical protein [Caudoviricetes sp.]